MDLNDIFDVGIISNIYNTSDSLIYNKIQEANGIATKNII